LATKVRHDGCAHLIAPLPSSSLYRLVQPIVHFGFLTSWESRRWLGVAVGPPGAAFSANSAHGPAQDGVWAGARGCFLNRGIFDPAIARTLAAKEVQRTHPSPPRGDLCRVRDRIGRRILTPRLRLSAGNLHLSSTSCAARQLTCELDAVNGRPGQRATGIGWLSLTVMVSRGPNRSAQASGRNSRGVFCRNRCVVETEQRVRGGRNRKDRPGRESGKRAAYRARRRGLSAIYDGARRRSSTLSTITCGGEST
jgi:hypothetical protein